MVTTSSFAIIATVASSFAVAIAVASSFAVTASSLAADFDAILVGVGVLSRLILCSPFLL